MTSVNFPTTYSFDSMSRPIGLTDQNNYAAVSSVQYGPSNQLLSMNYFGVSESRTYNTLLQLTNVTIPGQLNVTYNYPTGTNNGKISSQTDAISGETVTYQYDSLNHLISASGSGWNQDFGYDGFGNLISKSGLNSPPLSIGINPANNQVVGHTYDNNGNDLYGSVAYDAENRMASAPGVQYAYDSRNKRVWKGTFDGNGNLTSQEAYFYGVDGQKLGTYTLYLNYGTGQPLYLADPNTSLAVFFGGKRVAVNGVAFGQDRLGSNSQGKFFPYGEDRGTPIANDQVKFATYTRDSATGLDYADQRYYSSQFGRFMTPDPNSGTGRVSIPQSWNLYTYVLGDPITYHDPKGWCESNSPEGGPEGPPDPGPDPYPYPGPGRGCDPPPGPYRVPAETPRDRASMLAFDVKTSHTMNDCEAFAHYLGFLSTDSAGNKDAFLRGLGELIPTSIVPSGLRGTIYSSNNFIRFGNGPNDEEGYQSGYLNIFQDSEDPNMSQSHHAAAFFQLGAAYWWLFVNPSNDILAATALELWQGDLNTGDIALGTAAALLGAYFKIGAIKPDKLEGEALKWCKNGPQPPI